MTVYSFFEEELQKANVAAGDRYLVLYGYQTPGIITCAALAAVGATVRAFVEIDGYLDAEVFFNKPVFPLEQVITEVKAEKAFLIDVSQLEHQFDKVIEVYGLTKEEYSRVSGLFKYKDCDIIDPLLSYNRIGDLPGFQIHGDISEENALRIVALGGSTTDPSYAHLKSWPHFLHEKLRKAGIPNIVFNGGIVGYTSAQERDKCIRDAMFLSPDVVLILSGDNDIGWNHCYPDKNYYPGYLIDQITENVYPHYKEEFEEIAYGLSTEMKDYENWYCNLEIAHAVCNEMKVPFYCCLQPSIFTDGYQMCKFERTWFNTVMGQRENSYKSVSAITQNWEKFYAGVKSIIRGKEGFMDFTDAFDHVSGIYIDGIHCCEKGNSILADKMMELPFFKEKVTALE